MLLPPAAWVTDLLTRYMAIRYASTHDRLWLQHLSTVSGLVLLAIGVRLCRQARSAAMQQPTPGELHDEAVAGAAIATLSTWGLAMALFFFLLIAAQAYPALVLTVREIT